MAAKKAPSARAAPDLVVSFNYATAADLQHALLAAYTGLKEHDEEVYNRIMATVNPFLDYLGRYLDNPNIVKRKAPVHESKND